MKNFRSWLSHNLVLKCIALAIALLLWSYVYFVFGARIVRSITIQIQFINVAEQYVLEADHTFVEVLFSAPAHSIDQAEKNIRASIDLVGYSSGSFKRRALLIYPKGVTIESVTPPLIEVSIEKIISKDFRLHPQLNGEITKGNVMGTIDLSPDYIIVRGPESLISQIAEAIVPIDVSNANADIFSSIEVLFYDQNQRPMENIDVNQRIIKVHVPIISSNISKIVPIVPQFKGTPLWRIKSVELFPSLVTLRGNGSIIENIQNVLTHEIDINGLSESATLPFRIIIPAETILENQEQSFEIRIILEEDAEKAFTISSISFLNLPEEFEASWLEESLQIFLYGPREILKNINALQVAVDLSKLSPGEHLLSIQILQIPKEMIVHVFPQKVRIKVIKKNS